jgi:hypothetical protein
MKLGSQYTVNPVSLLILAKLGDQMNFSYWRAKILSTAVEWAKSFTEFAELNYDDKMAMVVHSSFSILVFSEAFHTPERYFHNYLNGFSLKISQKRYTDRIVFPDGLSGFRNLSANIIKERSGLIPTVVAVINNILVCTRIFLLVCLKRMPKYFCLISDIKELGELN